MNALVPINQHDSEPLVPLAVRLFRENEERRAKWAALGVKDEPIMLRRREVEPSNKDYPPQLSTAPALPLSLISIAVQAVAAKNGALPMNFVINYVSACYGLPPLLIKSPARPAHLVRPRQIAAYLCHILCCRTTVEIGRELGNRDHTTILHAYKKIAALIAVDPGFAVWIECLKARLEATREQSAS